MLPAIDKYDQAWNAPNPRVRQSLLWEALTEECEMIEPSGRFQGRQAILERIEGFADRFPGARVEISTTVDSHNGLARYGWVIVGSGGDPILEGLDVVEVGADARLRRIVMFFGALSPT